MLNPWRNKVKPVEPVMDLGQIMENLQSYYPVKDVGVLATAESLGVPLKSPQQNVTVLLAGAHGLAKEKLVDLFYTAAGGSRELEYDDVDMEKIRLRQGPRENCVNVTGNTVLDQYPHLADLKETTGLKLIMEVAETHKNDLVSFLLLPAGMDSAVTSLIDVADPVFIFFDPSGTIPASKILEPYENLWETHHDKFHLVLAKASEDECELKRSLALAEIVQTLQNIPYIKQEGRIPTIYAPDLTNCKREWTREPLLRNVKVLATSIVRRGLEKLETDSNMLIGLLDGKVETRNLLLALAGIALLVILVLVVLLSISSILVLETLISSICSGHSLEELRALRYTESIWVEREVMGDDRSGNASVCSPFLRDEMPKLSGSGILLVISYTNFEGWCFVLATCLFWITCGCLACKTDRAPPAFSDGKSLSKDRLGSIKISRKLFMTDVLTHKKILQEKFEATTEAFYKN